MCIYSIYALIFASEEPYISITDFDIRAFASKIKGIAGSSAKKIRWELNLGLLRKRDTTPTTEEWH